MRLERDLFRQMNPFQSASGDLQAPLMTDSFWTFQLANQHSQRHMAQGTNPNLKMYTFIFHGITSHTKTFPARRQKAWHPGDRRHCFAHKSFPQQLRFKLPTAKKSTFSFFIIHTSSPVA
jgi:hypothetical protein